MVVSRWLVMPMAATSAAVRPAAASASRPARSCVCQISSASCSTQPGAGNVERQLVLCARDRPSVAVEDDGPRARGALVEGQDVTRTPRHAASARSRDGMAKRKVAP